MAASSKFIQLSSSVLMEYQYADQADLASHKRFTDIIGILKMNNAYTGENHFFNTDGSEATTNNVRDRAATLIDQTTGKYAYLNIDGISAYNDIDTNLTSTASLPNNPTGNDGIVYDKIILHFTQGFNFEQNEGLILEASFDDAQNNRQILGSIAYLEEDNYAQLNASPFLFAGKQYTSFIHIEIPALFNLIADYQVSYIVNGSTDFGAYNISPIGYSLTKPITFKFGFIESTEVINGNTFLYSYYQDTISLNKTDQFSGLTASVAEAADGDYYELQLLYNTLNIDNYITGLNNDGGSYIILHDIVVSEQIPSTGFVKTQDLQIAQIDSFGEAITFRPIIKNGAAAVSYKIDYVARLYNRNDNTQIWKTASVTVLDVKKYAKNLNKLNIGTNPIIANVYNNIVQKTLQVGSELTADESLVKASGYTKYVTSFINTANVGLSSNTVFQRVVNGETIFVAKENASINDTEIHGQGELFLDINRTDSYYRFIIYTDDKLGQKTQMNLNGIGKLTLQFFSNNDKKFDIAELDNSGANKSKGEVIFKIAADKAKELVGSSNEMLYVSAKPEGGGPETVVYKAKYTGPGTDQIDKNLNNAIRSLRNDNLETSKKLKSAEDTIIEKRLAEEELKDYINKVSVVLSQYKRRIFNLENNIGTSDNEIIEPKAPNVNDPQYTDNYKTDADNQTELDKVISEFKQSRGITSAGNKKKRPESTTQIEADVAINAQTVKKGGNKWK